jgi:nucleotide-binding universal stress UspA family protein
MTYATLMVHLELGCSNDRLLRTAVEMAKRFHADVIGIAASQPIQAVFGGSYACADVVRQDSGEIENKLEVAEAEFRSALRGNGGALHWRSSEMFGSLCGYIADEARSADLIITGVATAGLLAGTRYLNTDELVMQVGRPVLVVPNDLGSLKMERVVVGWKDTRETRRAAADALPLLKQAAYVAVVEIAAETDLGAAGAHVQDVVGWLKRQGVAAEAITSQSTGDDAYRLNAIALERNAGVIVAGAYGHSRLHEWVLGGVTRNLLFNADRYVFVSH